MSSMVIDERILPLVNVLNQKGYHTVSSCEGHWHSIGKWSKATVVFYAGDEKFRKLGDTLRELVSSGKISLYKSPLITGFYGTPDIKDLCEITVLPDTQRSFGYMRVKTDSVIREIVEKLEKM